MARPVYSVPLLLYTSETPTDEFEVPDGFSVVIRQVVVYSQLGEETIFLGFYTAGASFNVGVYSKTAYGVNACDYWEGRVVVPENSTIDLIVSSFSTYSSIYVGGYLLNNG